MAKQSHKFSTPFLVIFLSLCYISNAATHSSSESSELDNTNEVNSLIVKASSWFPEYADLSKEGYEVFTKHETKHGFRFKSKQWPDWTFQKHSKDSDQSVIILSKEEDRLHSSETDTYIVLRQSLKHKNKYTAHKAYIRTIDNQKSVEWNIFEVMQAVEYKNFFTAFSPTKYFKSLLASAPEISKGTSKTSKKHGRFFGGLLNKTVQAKQYVDKNVILPTTCMISFGYAQWCDKDADAGTTESPDKKSRHHKTKGSSVEGSSESSDDGAKKSRHHRTKGSSEEGTTEPSDDETTKSSGHTTTESPDNTTENPDPQDYVEGRSFGSLHGKSRSKKHNAKKCKMDTYEDTDDSNEKVHGKHKAGKGKEEKDKKNNKNPKSKKDEWDSSEDADDSFEEGHKKEKSSTGKHDRDKKKEKNAKNKKDEWDISKDADDSFEKGNQKQKPGKGKENEGKTTSKESKKSNKKDEWDTSEDTEDSSEKGKYNDDKSKDKKESKISNDSGKSKNKSSHSTTSPKRTTTPKSIAFALEEPATLEPTSSEEAATTPQEEIEETTTEKPKKHKKKHSKFSTTEEPTTEKSSAEHELPDPGSSSGSRESNKLSKHKDFTTNRPEEMKNEERSMELSKHKDLATKRPAQMAHKGRSMGTGIGVGVTSILNDTITTTESISVKYSCPSGSSAVLKGNRCYCPSGTVLLDRKCVTKQNKDETMDSPAKKSSYQNDNPKEAKASNDLDNSRTLPKKRHTESNEESGGHTNSQESGEEDNFGADEEEEQSNSLGLFYSEALKMPFNKKKVSKHAHKLPKAELKDLKEHYTIGNNKDNGHPLFESKMIPFTGLMDCQHEEKRLRDFKGKKMQENIVDYFLYSLKAQCHRGIRKNTLQLFKKSLVSVHKGAHSNLIEINIHSKFIDKKVLNKFEWEDFISAIFLSKYSEAFTEQKEKLEKKLEENLSPDKKPISLTIRTLTVFIEGTLNLLKSKEFQRHAVKITVALVETITEWKQKVHKHDLILDIFCKGCLEERKTHAQDLKQLEFLADYVIYGTPEIIKDALSFDEFYRNKLN